MRTAQGFPALVFLVIIAAAVAAAWLAWITRDTTIAALTFGGGFVVALGLAAAIQIAEQWERAVVLRLGKFRALKGPGLFLIIPVVDTVPYWIDKRVITTPFSAEKTLTKDTVPVNVDAVLFWKVVDPVKAALEVANYNAAIAWAAQTALRDVIGKTPLADMLEGREKIGDELRKIIDERTEPWGVIVTSVEVRDVLIPAGLEDAMSMTAQAERERQARVILGDSERQIAEKFAKAAETYVNDPTAFHLRAMNMLYEGLKRSGTIVMLPSTAVDSMQLGSMAGMTSLAMGLGRNRAAPGARLEPTARRATVYTMRPRD